MLGSSTIYADETVVQVLKEDGKAAVSESRMWVYAGSERSGQSVWYFEYQPNRSGKHAAAFLKGFHGCLVTDGYAGYNQVEGVTRCGCWAQYAAQMAGSHAARCDKGEFQGSSRL